MEYVRPNYFDQFRCIAQDCPDTCCAGWQIVIDGQTQQKYKENKSPFGNRLHNEIDWQEGCFRQYAGRCSFLNEDNLCDIYQEMGEDALCRTCKMYPRYVEEFAGVREEFLCMSCPVVADLLLGRKEKTKLLYEAKEEDTEDLEEVFDFFFYTKLEDSRDYMLDLLQNRSLSARHRFGIALGYAHDMQRRIRDEQLFQIDALLVRYQKKNALQFYEEKMQEMRNGRSRYKIGKALNYVFLQMEIRQPSWKRWLERVSDNLYKKGDEDYLEKRKKFIADCKSEGYREVYELFTEQIVVYFILHYYCGAVYDGRAYTKVKFAVMSTFFIEEMMLATYLMGKKLPEKSAWVAIVYQFARELEHADENILAFEKALTNHKVFSLKNMLAALAYD